MKKAMAMLLAVMLFCSLTACGTKQADPESSGETEETVSAQQTPESEQTDDGESSGSGESGTETAVSGAETVEAGEGTVEIKGGTNQNDAVLLPLDTKVYGTVRDGRPSWFAFTTGEEEGAVYKMTSVNKTLDSCPLRVTLYDEDGTELRHFDAVSSGQASTVEVSQLEPETTYYFTARTYNNSTETIHYMLLVRPEREESEAVGTTDSLLIAENPEAVPEGEIHPGMNQDDAAMIPLDSKISGTVKDGHVYWFAFRTGKTEGGAYKFTSVNESAESWALRICLYDEDGTQLAYFDAASDGRASTIERDTLEPDTVYYIGAASYNNSKETINYTLIIKSPEPEETPTATVEKAEEEDDLLFETPFELNSTQVMFVANRAEFVDPSAAEEALEPVARVILAHPDHPVLLAGTTASDGTQEACVVLSGQRAEAVKQLLVSRFGVPEDQLLTVGLGYEDDPFVRGRDRDANGNFVETEGAKNRRVVVMDAEDPTAQEILQA